MSSIPIKSVSKINVCRLIELFNVCSLSVAQTFSAMSSTDSDGVCVVSSPGTNFKKPKWFGEILLCAVEDKIYFSAMKGKEVKIWNRATGAVVGVYKSGMNPHGIAHRFNKGHEEIIVCFLTEDADLMSTKQSKGVVKVLPLEQEKTPYDFVAETFPAPTRVVVSKLDGLVCLSYPSIGQISVHNKDGLTIHCFGGNDLGVNPELFRPFGVCFDNENGIVIADRDGAQVLRVTLFGQVIQSLVKGNKPTAVDVGSDDKLWVRYEDTGVTVFQMTNKGP